MLVISDNLIKTTGGISLVFLGFGANRVLTKSTMATDLDNCGKTNINVGLVGAALTGVLLTYTGLRSMM
jgi:hypothetical protein